MARAKLTAMASEWVKKGPGKAEEGAGVGKHRMTVYLSKRANKLLWARRVDTGIPVSKTIEDIVIKEFGEKYSKNIGE